MKLVLLETGSWCAWNEEYSKAILLHDGDELYVFAYGGWLRMRIEFRNKLWQLSNQMVRLQEGLKIKLGMPAHKYQETYRSDKG